MLRVTPNFHFSGRCRQAMELYRRAFGAEITELLTNADADPRDYTALEGEECLVYHAEMRIGEQRIMLSDDPGLTLPVENPLSLVVTFETADEVRNAYEILAKDGEILQPLHKTTYSSCAVSLRDRFGMRWELMTEQTER